MYMDCIGNVGLRIYVYTCRISTINPSIKQTGEHTLARLVEVRYRITYPEDFINKGALRLYT